MFLMTVAIWKCRQQKWWASTQSLDHLVDLVDPITSCHQVYILKKLLQLNLISFLIISIKLWLGDSSATGERTFQTFANLFASRQLCPACPGCPSCPSCPACPSPTCPVCQTCQTCPTVPVIPAQTISLAPAVGGIHLKLLKLETVSLIYFCDLDGKMILIVIIFLRMF